MTASVASWVHDMVRFYVFQWTIPHLGQFAYPQVPARYSAICPSVMSSSSSTSTNVNGIFPHSGQVFGIFCPIGIERSKRDGIFKLFFKCSLYNRNVWLTSDLHPSLSYFNVAVTRLLPLIFFGSSKFSRANSSRLTRNPARLDAMA